MARRGRGDRRSRYNLWVTPPALRELADLPGHTRQRVKRAVEELRDEPRPPGSQSLEAEGLGVELRRLRLDRWRVVYAVSEADKTIDVLAVRKRPPYDYGDLAELVAELDENG